MELLITSLVGSIAAIAMAVSNYYTNKYKFKALQEQFISLKDYLTQFEGGIITVRCPNCGHLVPVDAEALILKIDELACQHPTYKIKSIRGDKNDNNQ